MQNPQNTVATRTPTIEVSSVRGIKNTGRAYPLDPGVVFFCRFGFGFVVEERHGTGDGGSGRGCVKRGQPR